MQNRSYPYLTRKGVAPLFLSLLLIVCLLPGLTAAQNWVQTTEIPATPVYAIAELNGALYAAADSAIYVSTNGGGTWAQTLAQPTRPGGQPGMVLHGANGTGLNSHPEFCRHARSVSHRGNENDGKRQDWVG